MPKSKLLIAALALLLLPACSGVNPNTAWDPYYDFAGPRTYDWAEQQPETGPDLPYEAFDRAIKRVVDAEMSAAGFTRSSSAPAFRVAYYIGVEEVTSIADEAYYGPGWGAYWAFGWDGPAGLNVSQYDDGSITIDVLSSDPSIGLVWRGIAHTELTPPVSADRVDRAVESAVRPIFEDFPPVPRD